MILLDSDVLLIDLRYSRDPKFADNHRALQLLTSAPGSGGVTQQVLLEVVGALSFNSAPADIPHLPSRLTAQYGLAVFPDLQQHPDYAGCRVQELMAQMSKQMALSDAIQAIQIAHYASFADCLLTWNAKHFQGKLVIPVLTPQEWLKQRSGSTP